LLPINTPADPALPTGGTAYVSLARRCMISNEHVENSIYFDRMVKEEEIHCHNATIFTYLTHL
jgi:hypothetical protein